MSAPFIILVDGLCPLCRREGELLLRLDKGRGRIRIEDIADPAFDPARFGTTIDAVMGHIHAVMPDGSIVKGMEVFRRAYTLVGWGWLWAPTGWPILKPLFDRFYNWFARNRYRITFRKNPCESGRCAIPDRP